MQLLISDKAKGGQHDGTAEKVKQKNDTYKHIVRLVLGGHGFALTGGNKAKVEKFFDTEHKLATHKPTAFDNIETGQLQSLPLLVTNFVQEYKKITERDAKYHRTLHVYTHGHTVGLEHDKVTPDKPMALSPGPMARLLSYYLKDFRCCVKVKLHVCFTGILLGENGSYVQKLTDELTGWKDEIGPRDQYDWGTAEAPSLEKKLVIEGCDGMSLTEEYEVADRKVQKNVVIKAGNDVEGRDIEKQLSKEKGVARHAYIEQQRKQDGKKKFEIVWS